MGDAAWEFQGNTAASLMEVMKEYQYKYNMLQYKIQRDSYTKLSKEERLQKLKETVIEL